MVKKKLLFIMMIAVFLVIVHTVSAAGIEIPGGTGLSEDSFAQVFDRVLNWMLMIFVILATMAFVITGLQFIFSFGGASGTQESAKKNLTYTIIAIFIVGGALIILNTVVGLLGDAPAGSASNVGGSQNTGFDFGGIGGPFDTGVQHEPGATGSTGSTTFGAGSGLTSPITNDASDTNAGPNGGIYIQEGTTSAGSTAPGTVYQGNTNYDDSYNQN